MDLVEQGGSEEIDVDGLLESISSPEPERGMRSDSQPVETPTTPTVQEYEYDWNGQKIKAPIDQILRRASAGHDYAQKIEQFKNERAGWDTEKKTWEQQKLQEFEKKYSRYKEVDEYVSKDPQWWEHVQQSYASREQKDPNLAALEERIKSFEERDAQRELEAQQKVSEVQMQKEDEDFDKDMQGIREKYPDLPWDVKDPEGKSLVYKVMEHGVKEGIKRFSTAFKDFYHSDLEKRWESRGREAVTKDTQKRTKAGLLGETPTPVKGLTTAKNIKSQSYDDLLKEGLEELGISI